MKKGTFFIMVGLASAGALLASSVPQTKIQKARAAAASYYHSFSKGIACLRAGTCPELRKQLQRRAIQAGAAAAAVGAVAGAGALAHRYYSEDDLPEISVTGPAEYRPIKIGDILDKYGVQARQDNSDQSVFITAVMNGARSAILPLLDRLQKNILQAGKEVADRYKERGIAAVIQKKIDDLKYLLKKRNLFGVLFLGLENEVRETMTKIPLRTIRIATDEVEKKMKREVGAVRGSLQEVHEILKKEELNR